MMRVVFVFFILAVMAEDKETIKAHWDKVILTCPGNPSEWGSKSQAIRISGNVEYTFPYEGDHNGMLYYCIYNNKKYSFYFKGKLCEKCYELDGMWLLVIISGDLLVTGGVILFAYRRAQWKSEPPPAAAANHQSASREPESNYEDLSPRTRDNATYAGVHRTG